MRVTTSVRYRWLEMLSIDSKIIIEVTGAAAAKSLQSCPTLCDPTDGSPPGSPVPGILQARTLEWVAMSFSNAGKWKAKVKSLSRVWLLATPWTEAYQAPLSMGFSRQMYWSGLPLPSPIEVTSSVLIKRPESSTNNLKWWQLHFLRKEDIYLRVSDSCLRWHPPIISGWYSIYTSFKKSNQIWYQNCAFHIFN